MILPHLREEGEVHVLFEKWVGKEFLNGVGVGVGGIVGVGGVLKVHVGPPIETMMSPSSPLHQKVSHGGWNPPFMS